MEDSVVIVGAGLAGYTLAKELRKLAPARPITLVTADRGALYSKPMLSNALSQGQDAAALVQASAAQQAEKLGIRVLAGCAARAIRRPERVLETDAGTLPYGDLVLAVGARPRPSQWAADTASDTAVFSVNHLEDYARLRQRLQPGARVCIVGAGLVGCEFANDLALAGYAVTVVETAVRPLAGLLPEALSHRLMDSLARLGVRWRCGRRVAGVSTADNAWRVTLDDDETCGVDVVLAATGLIAETALAAAAGLPAGRGIVVNRWLATADSHVHALGDCAEVEGLWLPYVLPLMQQARALAATLAGQPTPLQLPALPVAVKTPACPLVVSGQPDPEAVWQQEVDTPEGAIYLRRDATGVLRGFALAGNACAQRRQWATQSPPLLA